MNKTLIIIFAIISVISTTAKADFLGLYAGGGLWNHDPSGGFQSQNAGSTNITVDGTLGMEKETEGYAYVALEHPIPLRPNVRLEKTALTHEGTSSGVTFNGVAALTGDAVASLDSTDLILYWRILDNWVNLDLGLTVRKFDGEFTIGSESLLVQETIPMAYAAVQFDLPFTGLSVGGDINVISVSGNSLTDTRVRILYEMGVIGVEAGLRSTSIQLDDVDNVTTDISFDGLFLGAFLHF
jgi:outer membrane protein